MAEVLAALVGQTIGVLLWSLLLNAPILQWRARKVRNWSISYKDAYLISIKAGFVALVVANAVVLAIAFSGNLNEQLLNSVGLALGLLSWWLVHTSALLKLAGLSVSLSENDARSLSASVLGYIIGGGLLLGLALVVVIGLISQFK